MLSILPATNQTQNMGFGADATHTTANIPDHVKNSPPTALEFPLHHPADLQGSTEVDRLIDRHIFDLSLTQAVRLALLDLPFLGTTLRTLKYGFRKR